MVTPPRVGVLAYPGCFASEVFGVLDLLTMASHVAPAGDFSYEVSILSPRRRVVASGGAVLAVAPLRPVDVLVVPGFELSPALDLDSRLKSLRPEIEAIRTTAETGVAVVSICVGAFLLADAGVLDGRRSTTSWLFADRLASRCPGTEVLPEELVITDSGVTTTGAFSAMYDFALGLIRAHHGGRVARATARIALVDDARSSQTPYVDTDLLPAVGSEFSQEVKRWLDQNLRERYDLGLLSATFHVSTRTLLRRFRDETGKTPLGHLQETRVRRAKHLLETTERTIAGIAAEVGYRDPGTFGAVFARLTGHRPRDYRAMFRRGRTATGVRDRKWTTP
ncbi:GlxA family transcriptional regulator [Amycolatopsis regifaucium]|uniref:AraC family transcriptional regulator n=1 Tax=Amycolatopsis regifaucium TaxID=546365 RepID=A0A154MRK1_9PSEU|nr:helix-turn-helix domain-containing protein [Amycolatopsis regifaucium]KZB86928.1 AraC family transcriptional regulator [Amycolatopsis regifaucium]OKA09358.1 AraC family transcriptional regulator [Amycolatopsis regifaucium]SFH59236.1 Transcriptional regulator GlxA family, contains an amidase domain and an AraC-type DNA-binding HTH domain [Amycolatopsis regifaucium]